MYCSRIYGENSPLQGSTLLKKLLTVKEVGELVQLNQRTVLKMLQSGEMPGTRIGAQWRIHPVLLEDWFMRQSGFGPSLAEEDAPLFRPTHVVVDIVCQSREAALAVLVERLAAGGETIYPELFLDAALERERMLSTGVGNGIAIPHTQHAVCQTLARPVVVVGRLQTPLAYGAIDGQPVDLLFFVASPPRAYLQTLATVNRLIRQQELVTELRHADSAAEIAELLTNAARQLDVAPRLAQACG